MHKLSIFVLIGLVGCFVCVSFAQNDNLIVEGKVGIGTAGPTEKLHVSSSNSETRLLLETTNATSNADCIRFGSRGSFRWQIGSDYMENGGTDFYIHDYVAGSRRLVIDSSGNVGIGTTSPSNLLDIAGQGETAILIESASNNPRLNPLIMTYRARNTLASPATVADGDTLLELWARGYNAAVNDYTAAGQIAIAVDGTPPSVGMPGMIIFGTVPYGTATVQTRMVIKNDGKVGIGTTSPTNTLTVEGSGAFNGLEGYVNIGRDAGGYTSRLDVEYGGISIMTSTYDEGGANSSPLLIGVQDGSYYSNLRLDSSKNLIIDSFNTVSSTWVSRLAIDHNSGNVGIGTTRPTSRLQVAGGDLGLGNATATSNQPVTIWLTNNSGAARSAGEIVIIGSANNSFTVTATANVTTVLGVVYDASIANGAVGRIAVGGVVSVLSAGATIRGQHVTTSATSGRAGSATPTAGASIGVWLESGGAAGSWRALLR